MAARKCPTKECNDDGICKSCKGTGKVRDFSVPFDVGSVLGVTPMKNCYSCKGTGKCPGCQYCANCGKELGEHVLKHPKFSGYFCSQMCVDTAK